MFKKFIGLIVIIGLGLGIYLLYSLYLANPLIISRTFRPPAQITVTPAVSLASVITTSLEGTTGTYGIVVKRFSTGESYTHNPYQTFTAGSLYKLWVMAGIYERIQSGKLSPNTTLSKTIPYLNRTFFIPDSSAELTSGTLTMSLEDALDQTITVSGNYSAMLLADYLTPAGLTDFIRRQGFNQSKVGTKDSYPQTSAFDIALFFEKLYRGQLANPAYTAQMLTLLKNQKHNEKLPLELPKNTVFAHKTGELDNFSHDAGIVFTPTGDYLIVVLSQSASPASANTRIGAISKAVFDYFSSNASSH